MGFNVQAQVMPLQNDVSMLVLTRALATSEGRFNAGACWFLVSVPLVLQCFKRSVGGGKGGFRCWQLFPTALH